MVTLKGIIFSVSKPETKKLRVQGLRSIDFKAYFNQYGLLSFFVVTVFVGIILGALKARSADSSLALGLDFLFTTNLDARLAQSGFETFCACFTSDFLFLFAVFLCGFAPWGMAAIPLITAFKGFGVGLCAGYLYSTYGLKGIGFYMLVLILGIFIFTIALIVQSQNSFKLSKMIFKMLFLSNKENKIYHDSFYNQSNDENTAEVIKTYLLYSGYMLIMSAAASFADTLLWCFFAPVFNF